MDALHVGSED